MEYCMKWENVKIHGYQIYKWNEKLVKNNISKDNAIFVFRRYPNYRIKRVFQVQLRSLIESSPSYETGNFRARIDSMAFSNVLFRSGLFWMKTPENEQLVRDLVEYTRSSFEFSGFTFNCPFAPRLVFVLDFSYTPFLHMGCPSYQHDPLSTLPVIPMCSIPHDLPGLKLSEQAEENTLLVVPAYDSDSNDDEVDSGEVGHHMDPNDPENRYSDAMKKLVTSLRRFRNVGRTFPLRPRSSMDVLGLVGMGRPKMWAMAFPGANCELCMARMKVGEVVIRLNCEHVFHRGCGMTWVNTNYKCPLCRLPSARPI